MKMTREAEDYISLLTKNANWLTQRILYYANQYHFTKYKAILQEDWCMSASGISESLILTVKIFGIEDQELHPNEDYSKNPVSYFGQVEAIKNQQRGVTIRMFMALIKYCRRSYLDLIKESDVNSDLKKKFLFFTERCFDRIELGYISQWTSIPKNTSISELQLLNHEIINEKNRYLAVFESLFAPIILLDNANRVINYNRAASDLFTDIRIDEELHHDNSALSSTLKDIANKIKSFVQSSQREYYFETIVNSVIGQHYYKILFKKMMDLGDTFRGTLVMLQDLTEQHITEENLQEAKAKAEEADKLKTAFLANMSHEIRTPMNAIIGFTELLLNEKYSKHDKNEYLKLIRRSSTDLLNIIEDIIEIAKMESKQLKIKYKACKPFNILTDLKSVFHETLRKYGTHDDVELILKVDKKDENIVFYSDGERLKQVFSNLLNNAIKFTDEGFIEFGYQVTDSSKLLFFVRDSGIGIPQGMKERIFERFFQLEEHIKQNVGGAGLGLAICKNIVNLLGGNIWVESREGKGSEFNFKLPFREVPKNIQQKSEQASNNEIKDYQSWHNKVFLIAEDDEINFLFLKEILNRTGVKVLHAKNGLKAIDIAETHEKLDLILMDMKMPEVDGIEATRYISTIRPNIPIIAQTAYALEGDKAKCINAGCCAYITKPVNKDRLFYLIDKYLSMKNYINNNYLIKLKP